MATEKRIRVTRTIVIEGPEDWVWQTLDKSLVSETKTFTGPERSIREIARTEEKLDGQ